MLRRVRITPVVKRNPSLLFNVKTSTFSYIHTCYYSRSVRASGAKSANQKSRPINVYPGHLAALFQQIIAVQLQYSFTMIPLQWRHKLTLLLYPSLYLLNVSIWAPFIPLYFTFILTFAPSVDSIIALLFFCRTTREITLVFFLSFAHAAAAAVLRPVCLPYSHLPLRHPKYCIFLADFGLLGPISAMIMVHSYCKTHYPILNEVFLFLHMLKLYGNKGSFTLHKWDWKVSYRVLFCRAEWEQVQCQQIAFCLCLDWMKEESVDKMRERRKICTVCSLDSFSIHSLFFAPSSLNFRCSLGNLPLLLPSFVNLVHKRKKWRMRDRTLARSSFSLSKIGLDSQADDIIHPERWG